MYWTRLVLSSTLDILPPPALAQDVAAEQLGWLNLRFFWHRFVNFSKRTPRPRDREPELPPSRRQDWLDTMEDVLIHEKKPVRLWRNKCSDALVEQQLVHDLWSKGGVD